MAGVVGGDPGEREGKGQGEEVAATAQEQEPKTTDKEGRSPQPSHTRGVMADTAVGHGLPAPRERYCTTLPSELARDDVVVVGVHRCEELPFPEQGEEELACEREQRAGAKPSGRRCPFVTAGVHRHGGY